MTVQLDRQIPHMLINDGIEPVFEQESFIEITGTIDLPEFR